jgi:hypothetical protein
MNDGATLFRSHGPAWRFTWNEGCRMHLHRTKRGTVYAISGISCGKPMWIGRFAGKALYTAERAIGAQMIQFDNGDEYRFNPEKVR